MIPDLCIRKGTFEVLTYVDNNTGCNLVTVSKELDMSPHTVYNRIGELVKMGWVSKDDKPRRSNECFYSITPKGHEAACLVQELYRTLEVEE